MRGECSGQLLLAVDEAVSNIVMHGSLGGEAHIELDVLEDSCAVAVRIRDDASPFDPTAAAVPELDTSPMEREQPGGFGVELMRRLVDELRYGVTDDGRNELILVKKRPE